jgi:hypothetical protein
VHIRVIRDNPCRLSVGTRVQSLHFSSYRSRQLTVDFGLPSWHSEWGCEEEESSKIENWVNMNLNGIGTHTHSVKIGGNDTTTP